MNKFVINIIAFCFLITPLKCEDKCKSCNDNVDQIMKTAGSVLNGLEPIKQEDVQICKIVSMTGMKTMKRTGETCIKKTSETTYYQTAGIGFESIEVSCQLKSLEETAEMAGIKLPSIPKISVPNPFGGKKEEEEEPPKRFVLAKWDDLDVLLEMSLDFSKDEYNVSDVKIVDPKFGNLKLWCDGDTIMSTVCGGITKPETIRKMIGAVIQFVARFAIADVFKMPDLADVITLFNCGEDDERR